MSDTTVTKVDSASSPTGKYGQKYLAAGKSLGMRLWDTDNTKHKPEETVRDYETVGYVIEGSATLELEGQTIRLETGDSWIVPKGAHHTYHIKEHFKAVEATHPPAFVHGRDE
jgi:quercetin dioxygenase-like cupin family protein